MDKKDLLRLLKYRLKEIESVISSMETTGIIHEIEKDIILSKIRLMYQEAKQLSEYKSSVQFKDEEPGDSLPGLEKDKLIEPAAPPEAHDFGNKEPEEEEPEEEKPEEKPEPMVITPRQSKLRQPDGKLLTGIRMQAVDDIMVAIGLNDRFLFTRELFNNDPELFRSTINELNQKNNLYDAMNYLDNNFNWDPDDPTLELFLNFVRRRFI